MKKNYKLSLTAIFVANALYSHSLSAQSFPADFDEFYQIKPQKVNVAIAGIDSPIELIADVNYDSIQLSSKQSESKQKIDRHLAKYNVKKTAIDKIIADLSTGILAENNCDLENNSCSGQSAANQVNYFFDYDNSRLNIFAATNLFEEGTEDVEYYEVDKKNNNALINWTEFSFYKGNKSDLDFTFRDNFTWGIGKGHLVFDSQYQYSNKELDIYDLYYQQEEGNTKFLLGYAGQYSNNLNATDLLQYDTNFNNVGLTISSSRELVKGKSKSLQRIYFYSPEASQLVISRGSQILLQRYVDAGQQSISYDSLPSGIYKITLTLKNGDNVIYTEQRQIVNNNSFDLAVKSYDYMFNMGYFEDLDQDSAYADIEDRDRLYLRGAVSYRPFESMIFSYGQAMNADDLMLQLGGKFILTDKINARVTSSFFVNDARYYSAQLNLYNFYLTGSKLDVANHGTSLSSLVYGDFDSTQIGAGFSSQFLGGRAYLNYYHYKNYDSLNSLNEGKNISASWSYPLFGGYFDLSLTYNDVDNGSDNINTLVSWNRNFGDNFSGRMSAQFDDNNYVATRADVSYNKQIKDANFSTSAGVTVDKEGDTKSELYASVNGDTESFAYNAYGYASSEDSASISGNISSTQIITKNSVDLTSQRSRSFVKISPKYPKDSDKENSRINYSLKLNNRFNERDKILGDKLVTQVRPYNYLEIALDSDTENSELDNISYESFVLPGTYHQISTNVTPLESSVIVLNDMFGAAIKSASCLGDGCISIEPLSSDGIFRINHRKGANVQVYAANNAFCINNNAATNLGYAEAVCLPDISNATTKLARANVKANDYILLDIVPTSPFTKEIISDIEKLKLETKNVSVNGLNYIYVKNKDRFKLSKQAALINKLTTQSVNKIASIN